MNSCIIPRRVSALRWTKRKPSREGVNQSMEIPGKISYAAERLKKGYRVNRLTVRDFLRHFGAERRGAVKVQAIRNILNSLDLETDPDFETAWIDGPMWLHLKDGVPVTSNGSQPAGADGMQTVAAAEAEEMVLETTPSAVELAEEQTESAPISGAPNIQIEAKGGPETAQSDDPTFRIGRLPAANKKLIVVNQNDTLTKAVTLLLNNDFSQLPVMHGEREVKGIVTWKSIGSKLALGRNCESVKDCREDARIVDSNRTLFDCIPTIVEYGYVLVSDARDRKITGMVTASDLSLEFQALSQPFLLLREIELHVRQLLIDKVSAADFHLLNHGTPSLQKPKDITDLSFGEYVRLVQHPDVWAKLQLRIDSGVLIELLERVRVIRNDVMHFDPDPMTADELATLKQAVRFMQELYELLP
jgi:CBS domain-containing protein